MIAWLTDPAEVDALLGQIHFRPRASLEGEVLGRWARGEGPPHGRKDPGRTLLMLGLSFMILLLLLFVLWSTATRLQSSQTIDRCCQDLDGGGRPDDGVLVQTRRGSKVERLSIYEDRDGTGGFTPADTVRFERRSNPVLSEPIGDGSRTVEFCCLDYDGGGPSDDALLVVGLPPDRIRMAAIYERYGSPGEPIQLR